MPKRGGRPSIALECETCGRINYTTTKNPKNSPDRLTIKKYCRYEKKVTLHKETK